MIFLFASAFATETMGFHLAQAKQFVKRGWWDDAAAEIEAAELLSGANGSWELHWVGAQVAYERCDGQKVIRYANRAAVLAPSDAAREQAFNLASSMTANFGAVMVRASRPDLTVRLRVERTSPQLDTELARITAQCAARDRRGVELPARIDLPVGDYTINGQAVHVSPGGEERLDLRNVGGASIQRTSLHVGGGIGVVLGERAALNPGPVARVLLDVPIGPINLGAGVSWAPQGWTVPGGGSTWSPWGIGGEARIGHAFALAEELDLTPWIGGRVEQVPGVGLGCAADGTCTTPDGEAAIQVYPVSTSIAPLGAIALAYHPAGRNGRVGMGVEASMDWRFGTLPASGTATFRDDSGATDLTWTTSATTWNAPGLRLCADLALSF